MAALFAAAKRSVALTRLAARAASLDPPTLLAELRDVGGGEVAELQLASRWLISDASPAHTLLSLLASAGALSAIGALVECSHSAPAGNVLDLNFAPPAGSPLLLALRSGVHSLTRLLLREGAVLAPNEEAELTALERHTLRGLRADLRGAVAAAVEAGCAEALVADVRGLVVDFLVP